MADLRLPLPTLPRLTRWLRGLRTRRETRQRNALQLRAIATLRAGLEGRPVSIRETYTAIDNLLLHFRTARCSDECLIGQRGIALNRNEMSEALSRARRGEIGDCIIHLGRGLPPEFSGIADALEREMERGR
jgi:hypothetical protein